MNKDVLRLVLILAVAVLAAVAIDSVAADEQDTCASGSCAQGTLGHGSDGKVTLCHVAPGSGLPVTIRVGEKAALAHLKNHPGDYLGPCMTCTPTPDGTSPPPTP